MNDVILRQHVNQASQVARIIALSQDKPRTTETGLNYRQSEAVVSTDLPLRAKIMAESEQFVNTEQFKAWKKLELQQWLKNHELKVSGTKEELVARVENAKQAGVTPAGRSQVRVPRGTLYCCVPLCHSFKGKVVNGKSVKLHRLPLDLKLRRQWIRKLRTVRKNLIPKAGTRVCSLHFKGCNGPKPWC